MATLTGIQDWSMQRDQDGHREYRITFRVIGLVTDGPAVILSTSGLPVVGQSWAYQGDADVWARCKNDVQVTPVLTRENNKHWDVQFRFSTKPDEEACKKNPIEDPLLVPDRITGSSVKYQEEAVYDRNGREIVNSAWEQFRGPQVEFDRNRSKVHVEQNRISLDLALCVGLVDHVNSVEMWGMPPRCVKLSEFSWERKFYGDCYVYYTRIFDLDLNASSFDRFLLDEGTKVLHGRWDVGTGAWVLVPLAGVIAPRAPSLTPSNTGGTLAPGTYTYQITAVNDAGETLPGPSAAIVLAAPDDTVTVRWANVPGATGYWVYGRVAGSLGRLVPNVILDGLVGFQDFGANAPGAPVPVADTTGSIDPDPANPAHFIRFTDIRGNQCRVMLDGNGLPAEVPVGTGTTPHTTERIKVEYYKEDDLLTLLGLPDDFFLEAGTGT
jgi:hypothetical protein